ncbi:MAG: hypothetical protein HGN29_15235 [Asgard group archaeon]|nr:hypothetical protein [Asgard group archaeon]
MSECDHKCSKCGEEWKCDFPYFSNHHFYEDVLQQGSYCNAWCPSSERKERKDLKELFESENEQYFEK